MRWLLPPGEVKVEGKENREATSVDKGHGRREHRTIRVTRFLSVHQKWAGSSRGFRITRERTIKGKTTQEVVYGITSLSEEEASASRLLELVRIHWHIENKLHYVKDVTLEEDACRARKGSTPQVLAAFRNVVVHLLKPTKEKPSRVEIQEELQLDLDRAKKMIGIP
jgi:predicted transposase YbfD/YdcC